MSIRIEIAPDEEAQLRERAARRGATLEELAADLLRAHLSAAPEGGEPVAELLPVVDENGAFREERWQAVEERLSQLSVGLPLVPPEALTREALYQDHD